MKNKLKPCPFCGGKAKIYHVKSSMYNFHWLECIECGHSIGTSDGCNLSKDEIIKAWNRRILDKKDGESARGKLAEIEMLIKEYFRIYNRDVLN